MGINTDIFKVVQNPSYVGIQLDLPLLRTVAFALVDRRRGFNQPAAINSDLDLRMLT